MSEDAEMQVPIHASETEIKALVEVLDVACKAAGIAVAERAAFWVQKLDRALVAAKAVPPQPDNPNVVPFEALHGAS